MVFDSFRPKSMVLERYEKSQKKAKNDIFCFFHEAQNMTAFVENDQTS